MAVKNYLINDKWLDIDKQNIVEVKSTDGVIGSVKVNGEEYGSGGGGESDFSTAEVTVTNLTPLPVLPQAIHVEDDFLISDLVFDGSDPVSVTAVLYKGSAYWTVMENNVVVTGDAITETVPGGTVIHITGDCTITIS